MNDDSDPDPAAEAIRTGVANDLIAERLAVQSRAVLLEAPETALAQARVFPNRRLMLASLGHLACVAELGVDNGDFSQELLALFDPDELVLIDSWSQERYASKEETIRAMFAADKRVVICKGLSTSALKTFPDGYFDLVYIDTNHTYETTKEELALAGKKVRAGGWISGHDFCPGNVVGGVVYGVIPAVTEFLAKGGGVLGGLSLEPSGHFSFLIRTHAH